MAEKPKRIHLKRTKGWRKPGNTVIVSRPSKYGNPFNWKDSDLTIIATAKLYAKTAFRQWLKGTNPSPRPDLEDRRQWILNNIADLRGKNLACWCKPGEPCHADVLLELANDEVQNG